MDRVAIADLELELGCLEVAGESSSLRQDHGDSDIFFDAPRDVTSRLEPPSKTKSIYTFGIDGTIAWVTPAGELLQVASCIKSRLIGVEYKKTIERGEGYNARGKLLERAVESAHGSGYGIGLSLAQGLEPYSVCWVHNRWPRFSFRYNDLDIRLQYYVEGNSVIQQYQIRNDAKVQADLPYSISSDICFREHRPGRNPFHVVPTEKSQERLLLFQNSEVLVRNTKFKAQYRTTTFLNTQRFSAWAVNPVIEASQEDDEEEEDLYLKEVATKQLANTISADGGLLRYDDNSLRRQCTRFYNRAPGRKQPEMYRKHNFAQSRSVITIPGESTQELCTVLEVSDLPLISDTPTANLQRQKDKEAETQKEKITEKVNHMQRRLTANANHSVLTSLDAANSPQMPQFTEAVSFINEHLRIAKACTKVERLGEARYHYWVACLIAEVVYNKKAIPLSDIRFQYAKFLHENGWHDAALKIMRDVYQYRDLDDIMNQDPKSRELTRGIRYRLASMYLEDGLLTEAGDIFDGTWSYFNKDMTPPDLNCYSFLERAAWTQVCQNKHEKAYESYSVLLNQRSLPRRIMLCNLAFVRRKTGYFQEAESLYRSALHCSDSGTTNATDDMITRSGLFACLRGLGKHAESDSELKSLRGYVDVNSRITLSPRFESPFDKAEFQFTMTRHLETLLSVYSIPILGEDGTSGNAFVDGDPLKCINDSSGAYWQYRFLVQCQKILTRIPTANRSQIDTMHRIRAACEGQLKWAFQIAAPLDRWDDYQAVDGAPESNDGESRREVTSKSNPIDVSCQFLKLSLYFHSWRDKWPFVLKLLHLRMDNWLSYLVSSRHMNNLWVEREDVESWKVKDTTSHDSAYVYGKHPRYHLSDSALLWLALLQLEKLIGLIENEIQLSNGQFEENTEIMIKDVRRDFNKHREALNLRRLRSDILKTHGISVGELGTSTVQEVLALTGAGATGVSASGTHRANDFSEQTQSQSDPTTTGKANIQAAKPDERVQKVIALERGIKELTFEIKAYDNATIEAVVFGIFDGPQDKAGEAWLNTMKLQQNKDIETIDDPCHLALASWASNFNYAICKSNGSSVTDAAYLRLSNALFDSGAFARDIKADRLEQTRAWSSRSYETITILVASLFEECRRMFPYSDNQQSERRQSANVLLTGSQKLPLPLASSESKFESRTVAPVVVIPEMLDTASSKDSQNAINTNFLPSWMYHYPDFIHNDTLVIDISKELEQLGYVESLRSAITAWRDQKEFNLDGYWDLPFAPSVIDSGIKKPTSSGDGLAERQIVIDHCWYGWSLQKRLLQSRTIDQAKKRLIELPSQSKESLLVCWLTASDQEKPFLLDFIRRHEMAENFFGERAHMLGNIWETEFHIGFYQLVDVERGDYPNDAVPLHGQSSRTRRMPTLTTTSHRHEIMPVAISFRFAGDLRDRFWTCHFLSSVATISGFRGLAEEHDRSMDSTEDFYKEKQGQRKILELVYVERALGEMKRSIDGLLAAFQKELAVPETRDPQGESFEFIYGYSSLHLKAGEILRDILSQLNMSINAISEWERREETRGFRSRWSEKDEERHGERLKDLSRKCKLNLQQLRVQQSRLQEQRGFVEQRHNNLVSYMQLREARTSTRSAEDVRLFTYVTIIFLPLSFSSSLFSMQGAPAGHTISIMAPTTIIALAATVLLLSNMKLLDRNWSFWMNRLHTDARKRMKASKHSWAVPWNKVSRELDEAAQRRLTKSDYERRLPAESKWWYFLFWAFYAAKVPRTLVMEGYTAWLTYPGFSSNRLILICRILAALLFAPICALIFICQVLLTVGYDTCNFLATMVLWVLSPRQDEKNAATQWKKNFRSRRRQARIERHAEGKDEKDRKEEKGNEVPKRSDTATTTARPSRVQDGLEKVTDWLISPPRPIRGHTAKWRPRKPDAANAGSDSAGSSSDESDDVSSFYSHELNSDDDDNWNGKAETQQQTDETGNGGEGEEDSSPPEAKELQREMNGAELEDSPKRRRWRGMFKKEKPEERV